MATTDDELYDASEYSTHEYRESADHIPTTKAIRATYATDYYMVTVGSMGTVQARAAAFDRWLAAHDADRFEAGRREGAETAALIVENFCAGNMRNSERALVAAIRALPAKTEGTPE